MVTFESAYITDLSMTIGLTQFFTNPAKMKSLLVITLFGLTGSSLGLFQPILTSFLRNQMNAARYILDT